MKYKVLFSLLFLLSFEAIANPDIMVIDVKGYRDLDRRVEALKLPQEDTVFIVDCDGTLTNVSVPENEGKAAPRGDSVRFFKEKIVPKYPFVVSSAWHSFDECEKRVRELGLEKELGLGEQQDEQNCAYVADFSSKKVLPVLKPAAKFSVETCPVHTMRPAFSLSKPVCSCITNVVADKKRTQGTLLRIMKKGKLISVAGQKSGRDSTTNKLYYRQKAFAPMVAYPNRKFKHVVVIDDNIGALRALQHDIQHVSYLMNGQQESDDNDDDSEEITKIYFFLLPQIHGGQFYADLLDVDTDDESSGSYEEPDLEDNDVAQTTPASTMSSHDNKSVEAPQALSSVDDDDDETADEAVIRSLAVSTDA